MSVRTRAKPSRYAQREHLSISRKNNRNRTKVRPGTRTAEVIQTEHLRVGKEQYELALPSDRVGAGNRLDDFVRRRLP